MITERIQNWTIVCLVILGIVFIGYRFIKAYETGAIDKKVQAMTYKGAYDGSI